VQGIEGSHSPFHGESIEQFSDHLDFIGGGWHLGLGDHGCLLMKKCGKQLYPATVFCASAFEGLAIYGYGRACRYHGDQPASDGRVHSNPIESLEETTDGRFTGRLIQIGSFISPASESLEHFLGAVFSPLSNGVEALGSAEDGADGNGEYGQSVVANTSCHAGVRDGEQCFVEEESVIFREFHGREPGFERWLKARVGELGESVLPKGPDKDRFDATVMDVEVALLGKTPGMSEKMPTGSTVAGASIEFRIDKGFRYPYRMSVGCLPVIGQALEVKGKNA